MSRLSLCFAPVVLLAAPFALAGGVGNVSHSPVVVHTDLQAAIDAAADGDALLVHSGTYSGFTIDNRSIAIFAVPGETVTVDGTTTIRNLGAARHVVLSGLTLKGGLSGIYGTDALDVTACAGTVWVQDCEMLGHDGVDNIGSSAPDGGDGGQGARVSSSSSVTFVRSSLRGGKGGYHGGSLCFPSCWLPGSGGAGLVFTAGARVAIYDCYLSGGDGGSGGYESGWGNDGIQCLGSPSQLFVSGSVSTGGDGGTGASTQNGNGGNGIRVPLSPTVATVLDCAFAGGNATGAPAGVPILGSVVQLTASARTFATATVARDASSVQATLGGVGGDAFFAPSSNVPGWLFKLAANGVWLLRYPTFLPKTPLATLPPSGSATANWLTPQVPSGSQAALRFSQGYALPAAGGAVLASPVCTLLLDVDARPDCNGNGVFDVLDIVEGATDANHDFVPDVCTSQLVWYVDDNAPPGGDGSLAAPFQAIQIGIDAALDGRTVRVLDGTYVGSANRDLDFHGKALVVESQNDAASTVIDCQAQGRAFWLHSGEGAATAIRGFTVRNGNSVGTGNFGGAIRVENGARLSLAQCTFDGNVCGGRGGAVAVLASAGPVDLRDCAFQSNSTPFNTANCGGGAVYCERDLSLSRCSFEANHSFAGGAVLASGDLQVLLGHSTFVSNQAFDDGGAVTVTAFASGDHPRLVVSNSLFAGNTVQSLGGAIFAVGTAHVTLGHSTFAGNASTATGAPAGGGAIAVASSDAVLRNCVLWGNTAATVGPQARILFSGSLSFDYCDVEGGLAGVYAGPGTLNWGAGNLVVDPLFVDEDGADNDPATFGDNVYRLKPTSPCLDAGGTTLALADVTDIDGDGNTTESVPLDLNLKLRFVDLPSIPDSGVGFPPVDLGCFERQN